MSREVLTSPGTRFPLVTPRNKPGARAAPGLCSQDTYRGLTHGKVLPDPAALPTSTPGAEAGRSRPQRARVGFASSGSPHTPRTALGSESIRPSSQSSWNGRASHAGGMVGTGAQRQTR